MADLRDHLRELIGGLLRPASVYMGGYWTALHPGEQRRVDQTIDEVRAAIRRAALEEAAQAVEACDLYDTPNKWLLHSDPRKTCAAAIRALAEKEQTDVG